MATPEGRTEIMGMMAEVFNGINGGEPLDVAQLVSMTSQFSAKQDEIAGGHWNLNLEDHTKATTHTMGIFGTDGKMTLQQY